MDSWGMLTSIVRHDGAAIGETYARGVRFKGYSDIPYQGMSLFFDNKCYSFNLWHSHCTTMNRYG